MTTTFTSARRPDALRLAATALAAVAAMTLAACGNNGANGNSGGAGASSVPTTHYVNTRNNAKAPKLAEDYVDFSFDYPTAWQVDPDTGSPTASNFIKVARKNPAQTDIENFAVGYFEGTGDATADQTVIPQLIDQLGSQFAQGFPGYKEVDRGATTVAGKPGQQMRFTASTAGPDGKPINIYGRMILMTPAAGTKAGAVLLMLATDVSGEFHSVDDVGAKGQTPIILNSFKMGA